MPSSVYPTEKLYKKTYTINESKMGQCRQNCEAAGAQLGNQDQSRSVKNCRSPWTSITTSTFAYLRASPALFVRRDARRSSRRGKAVSYKTENR